MKGGRGSKNVCFCPRSGYKKCARRAGGQKVAKFCPLVVECPPTQISIFEKTNQVGFSRFLESFDGTGPEKQVSLERCHEPNVGMEK